MSIMNNLKIPTHLDSDNSQPSRTQSTSNAPPIVAAENSYFSSTPYPRPQLYGLGRRDLGVILNKRRATLRNTIRGAGSSWIDQDDSGTYDPRAARATPPATPPRRRKRTCVEDEDGEDGIPRPPARKSYRRVGYGLLVTFKFISEKGLDYLRSITPGAFDSQSPIPDENLWEYPSNPKDNFGFGPYLPRRKTRRPKKSRQISGRNDDLTIDQLTVGHPQRRGCKACFDVGDDGCSLIEHGYAYPCTACDDAGIDCELIIPPRLKNSCERCKRKRISCSYRIDGGEGEDSCEACKGTKEKCFAAPRKSSVRRQGDNQSQSGRQASSETSACAPPPRLYVSCNQCRENGLRCSLKRDQPGPCRHCSKEDEDCAFVLTRPPAMPSTSTSSPKKAKGRFATGSKKKQIRMGKQLDQNNEDEQFPTPSRLQKTLLAEAFHEGLGKKRPQTLINERTKKKAKVFRKSRRRSSNTETPEWSQVLGISKGIQHVQITTHFSHPIEFNYVPDPMGSSPCSWCGSPFFGLYGHGSKEVEVIPFPNIDGNGYEEICGGHAEDRIPSTQMCVTCTFQRVGIMGCERHEIRPIEVDPRIQLGVELENSFHALVEGDEAAGQLALNTKWCSICPAPAYFKCCAHQGSEGLGNEPTAANESGCGLLLCTYCEDFMKKLSGDGACTPAIVLDRLVRECSNNAWIYEDGPRADASFLTSTGELMVRIQRGMGEGTESRGGDGNDDIINEDDDGDDDDEEEEEGEGEEEEDIQRILERVRKGRGTWIEQEKQEKKKTKTPTKTRHHHHGPFTPRATPTKQLRDPPHQRPKRAKNPSGPPTGDVTPPSSAKTTTAQRAASPQQQHRPPSQRAPSSAAGARTTSRSHGNPRRARPQKAHLQQQHDAQTGGSQSRDPDCREPSRSGRTRRTHGKGRSGGSTTRKTAIIVISDDEEEG